MENGRIIFTGQFNLLDKGDIMYVKNQKVISIDDDIFTLPADQDKLPLSPAKIDKICRRQSMISKKQPYIKLINGNHISREPEGFTLLDTHSTYHVIIGNARRTILDNTEGVLVRNLDGQILMKEIKAQLAGRMRTRTLTERDLNNMLKNIYLIDDETMTESPQYEVLSPSGAKSKPQRDTSQEHKL